MLFARAVVFVDLAAEQAVEPPQRGRIRDGAGRLVAEPRLTIIPAVLLQIQFDKARQAPMSGPGRSNPCRR